MTTHLLRVAIFSVVIVGVLKTTLLAQTSSSFLKSDETPAAAPAPALPPSAPMPMTDYPTPTGSSTGHEYLGVDLGVDYSWLWGASNFFFYSYDFGHNISTVYRFNNLGSGLGGIFGFKGGLPLTNSIDLEGKLRYLTNYTSATETQPFPVPNNSNEINVTNNYTMLLSNLDLAALLHFALSDRFYLAGGLSLSALLSSNFSATQTMPPNANYYTDAGVPTNVTQEVLNTSGQWFNGGRFDLQVGAGTILPSISDAFALDLELLLSIPLSSWISSDQQANFDQFANQISTRNAGLNEGGPDATVVHPSFPNLWYASLTIGLRLPFGNQPGAQTSEAPPPSSNEMTLAGTVTDANTGRPIEANITVVNLADNEVVTTTETDREGRYSVKVPSPGRYSVTADATDYLFGTAYFTTDNQGRLVANHPDIKLSPASGGRTRLLVFFDFNSSDLKESSYPELNRAVRLMKAVPSMRVEIAGYTDNVGSTDYNLDLSKRRANAVRDYLIRNGVDGSRVTAVGYGPDSPVGDNNTDEGRAENRRVEFVVLSR